MELVTIATCGDVTEAEYLRNQLEAEGFEVYIADDNILGINNLLAPAIGWVKIRVPSERADEAAQMVSDLRNAEIVYDENFPEN